MTKFQERINLRIIELEEIRDQNLIPDSDMKDENTFDVAELDKYWET